jgi:cytochrome c oxidase subunit IV
MQQSHTPSYWIRPCTWVLLILLALTLAAWGVGQMQLGGLTVVSAILLSTLVKGQMVVDFFMGLIRVRPFWRILMFSYLFIVIALIWVAYFIGLD